MILSGLVRTQEKVFYMCFILHNNYHLIYKQRPPFSPKNDPDNNRWSWRDVVSMAQCLETTPVMIDADASNC